MLTALTNYSRYLFLVTFLTLREAYEDINVPRIQMRDRMVYLCQECSRVTLIQSYLINYFICLFNKNLLKSYHVLGTVRDCKNTLKTAPFCWKDTLRHHSRNPWLCLLILTVIGYRELPICCPRSYLYIYSILTIATIIIKNHFL